MSKYNVTIGMEIHVELKTKSKMFSSAPNKLGTEDEANTSIDAVTTAQPGALPVPNKKAIKYVQMAGIALGCKISKVSKFDRKHYFYPDLPKGYQISQFDQPLCEKGSVEINGRKIGITRIHIEEDTGKNIHDGHDTLVNLNRAGLPLMELVSEPDIRNAEEARAFCQELQRIFRYAGIADADIEKGQMRCEVNISLYKDGEDPLSGTKVEIKNIGSFRSVQKAVEYEIIRQTEDLNEGEIIKQETRGWNDTKQKTISQRSKENANDYRYFPEPDIPPMTFDDRYIQDLIDIIPELPQAKRFRFKEQYNTNAEILEVLIDDRYFADYYENVVSEIRDKKKTGEFKGDEGKAVKLIGNYLVNELPPLLTELEISISNIKISAENFAELIAIIADGKINSSAAQTVLNIMAKTGGDPSNIVEDKNLAQENNEEALGKIVFEVMSSNEKAVNDYKEGNERAIKALMGQVMARSKGKANPQAVMQILKEKLK